MSSAALVSETRPATIKAPPVGSSRKRRQRLPISTANIGRREEICRRRKSVRDVTSLIERQTQLVNLAEVRFPAANGLFDMAADEAEIRTAFQGADTGAQPAWRRKAVRRMDIAGCRRTFG
jgi:hypothetical protein